MKKGELTWDVLVPWIIGIGVLVLSFVLYGVLSGKGSGALDYFKQIWRFGN